MNIRLLILTACIFVAAAGPVAAQDVVEHSLGTAGSSTATTGSRGVGKSVGSIFGKLKTTTEKAGSSQIITVRKTTAARAEAKDPSVSSAADTQVVNLISACADTPDSIAIGTAYDDLLANCGTPALKTSGPDGGEVLYFSGKNGELAVTVEGGKVKAVKPPKASKEPKDSKTAAIVILK